MSLKRKLSRLGPPSEGFSGERRTAGSETPPSSGFAPDSAATIPEHDTRVESRSAHRRDVPNAKEDSLQTLRKRMDSILGSKPAPPALPVDPIATELPFALHETPNGAVHRRCERLAASTHVGRMPVDAAREADASVLALLALCPALAVVAPERALYLDCETTGLGGAGTLPFLVGLAWFDQGRLVLEQLLLRTPAEEPGLLAVLADRAKAASLLVTYNGKTFDWPLLNTRCVMNRVPALPALPHLDLLHVARRLHRERLGACRLTDLETEVLGFVRGPDIAGADVAARYGHFLRTDDESALRAVVDHNAYDVLTMAALVGLYGEPLDLLHERDLLGLARTYSRAKAWDEAERAVDAAALRGVTLDALRLKALIAKARGDRARALLRFEELTAQLDDQAARFELAKLYEHFIKAPGRALAVVHHGTGESPEGLAKRKLRLERKLQRGADAKPRAPRWRSGRKP